MNLVLVALTHQFEGTATALSARDMDSSEVVVREILRAFDRGKAVAYPGRLKCGCTATWLPRLLPRRSLIVRIAAMATEKMGLRD